MVSLEEIANRISLSPDLLSISLPGEYTPYNVEKKRSSSVALAPTGGFLVKRKVRDPKKALYEFMSLMLWHDVLEIYSQVSDLNFLAPRPISILDFDSDESSIVMEFLPGYRLKALSTLKRHTPIKIKGQRTPLPLYVGCALHLGAINAIKEKEGFYHSDYDGRHVLFDPQSNPSIGVIDVENSRLESDAELVVGESDKIWIEFRKHTCSPRDLHALDEWYHVGRGMVSNTGNFARDVLKAIEKEKGVSFNPYNKSINGIYIL